ncbi:MAG: anhydro-N-acetylmuramic acid kinase [Bacteroidetes bacterium]|nr:anhydro-N-acetylmuramic acid kinase [Bacteroidota bacterium]
MLYKVIGLMSGSSLDGLDIAYVHLQETAGKWTYEIQHSACYPYNKDWIEKLERATLLPALEYQLLHTAYGNFIGEQVNRFIDEKNLHYQVQIIASHGHTTFHVPQQKMTAQLGEGAAIAAATNINVVSDLRSMDVALGGQGAPIIPIGEKLLLGGHHFFLNIGGIANISAHTPVSEKSSEGEVIAFDVCPANRVLNMLANKKGKLFDEDGAMASTGSVNMMLLEKLNRFTYYGQPYPKSLANDFGVREVFPVVEESNCSIPDAMRTYAEHICLQIKNSIEKLMSDFKSLTGNLKLLATGGGAHNIFLMRRLRQILQPLNIEVVIPESQLIDFKEALVVALIGALRWREENNVLSSVTGAKRSSVGGAVWIGS